MHAIVSDRSPLAEIWTNVHKQKTNVLFENINTKKTIDIFYIGIKFEQKKLLDAGTLLVKPAIGLDCEGVALGRFGQLCTMQISVKQQYHEESSNTRIYLIDTLNSRNIVKQFGDTLFHDANIIKVLHDCREDKIFGSLT